MIWWRWPGSSHAHSPYAASWAGAGGSALPGTGLVEGRRFLYVRGSDNLASDERFAHVTGSALRLSGNDYAIVVLMAPAGTLVYRPNGDYADLPGFSADGWRWTYLD